MRRTRPLGFAEERQNDRDLAARHRLVAPEFADGEPVATKRQTVLEDRKHHVPVFFECEVLVGPEGFRSRSRGRNFLFGFSENDHVETRLQRTRAVIERIVDRVERLFDVAEDRIELE